jgi:hypothetical protein
MKLHLPGMIFLLAIFLGTIWGCSILPPDISVKPHVEWKLEGGKLLIVYIFTNDGTVDLENFKFRFGIDDTFEEPGIVDYNHETDWYPAAGTTLNVGEKLSGEYNTGLDYAGLPAYVGVYEMGFDNPPDN